MRALEFVRKIPLKSMGKDTCATWWTTQSTDDTEVEKPVAHQVYPGAECFEKGTGVCTYIHISLPPDFDGMVGGEYEKVK